MILSSGELPRCTTPIEPASHVVRSESSALDALQAPRTLPTPLTSLVGREREVAIVRAILLRSDVRLLTLTGPGGVGKTRLAIRVAEEVAAEFTDGVIFLPLASVAEPSLVLATLAGTLGLRETGEASLAEGLYRVLHDSAALLFLDNFEHLLEAGPAISELLEACPRLVVLATSRALLGVSGEWSYSVPPLGLPALPAHGASPPLETLAPAESVRLFTARAQAVHAGFNLTRENALAVAAICQRLDGLPLAIELAAARIRLLPPDLLLARMARQLPLLTGGPRDQPARLQTMRSAIAWSYDLLDRNEQALLRRLSVFVGGFTLEAAEALGGDASLRGDEGKSGQDVWRHDAPHSFVLSAATPPKGVSPSPPERSVSPSVLDLLGSLIEKSLVEPWTASMDGVGGRFRMLETVRQFARERLAAEDEQRVTRDAHAAFVLELAVASEIPVHDLALPEDLDRIEAEHGNVHAAMAWLYESGQVEHALQIAQAVSTSWFNTSHLAEVRAWLEHGLLEADETVSPAVRVKSLARLGVLALAQGDLARAEAAVASALGLVRDRNEPRELALVHGAACFLAAMLGEPDRAESHGRQSVLSGESCGDHGNILRAKLFMGRAAQQRGDLRAAVSLYEEALASAREIGSTLERYFLLSLASIAQLEGNSARAARLHARALQLDQGVREPTIVALSLDGFAIAVVDSAPLPAARFMGRAHATYVSFQMTPMPFERPGYQAAVAQAKDTLGDAAFTSAWTEGSQHTLQHVIGEAIDFPTEALGADAPAAPPPAGPALTARELEVLRLLITGQSDSEIAGALFVSRRTVQTHVTNILTKLGAVNRTEAAAIAVRDGLV